MYLKHFKKCIYILCTISYELGWFKYLRNWFFINHLILILTVKGTDSLVELMNCWEAINLRLTPNEHNPKRQLIFIENLVYILGTVGNINNGNLKNPVNIETPAMEPSSNKLQWLSWRKIDNKSIQGVNNWENTNYLNGVMPDDIKE